MTSPRSQILALIEKGAIPKDKIGEALMVAKVLPDGSSWRRFVDQLLLWLGGLALAVAAVFFIAYNWNEIGRFAKFGMVEAFMVLAILAYLKFDIHSAVGRVSLLVATIGLGVLLALYGQTYQTGADTWQLFFTWSLLMLPWAIIGRFPALWIVWIALLNTSLVLYHQTFMGIFWFLDGSETGMLWLLFLLNSVLLAVWEVLAKRWDWLAERWAVRLLAACSGGPITWLVLQAIFDRHYHTDLWPALVWLLWMGSIYLVYRKIKADLFMLALGCLSAIVVITSFVGEPLSRHDSGIGFLLLSLLVVGLGAGAAFWLKNVHQESLS